MSELSDRFVWALQRRIRLASSIHGFWASCRSYATPDCKFSANNRLYRRSYLRDSSLGRMSYVAEGSRIGYTSIGAFSSIGPNVSLGGLGKHPTDHLSTHPAFYSARPKAGTSFVRPDKGISMEQELPRTNVGNDVWMGVGCIVLDGLNIGDGAVIAAGAVVTKDVPPYAIVGGVPAHIIRYRFDEATIAKLLDWRWWNLSNQQLEQLTPRLMVQTHWSPEIIDQLIYEIGPSNAYKRKSDLMMVSA